MSIYTKRGDRGITDMAHAGNISKSDDRIRLMGEADELNSHIDLVKSMLHQSEILQLLERIQKNLDLIAAGVSNPYDRDCKVSEKETAVLEAETDKLEALCEKPVPEKLTGKSRLAAEIDIARTVARRTERCLAQVSVKFGADTESKRFLNRLSDYLYILARYIEYYSDLSVELSDDHAGALAKTSDNNTDALPEPSDSNTDILKKTADNIGYSKETDRETGAGSCAQRAACGNRGLQSGRKSGCGPCDGWSIPCKLRCGNEESLYCSGSEDVYNGTFEDRTARRNLLWR